MSRKLKLLAVILAFLIATAFGLFLLVNTNTTSSNLSQPTNGELNVQIGLEKNEFMIGEELTFKSYIKNTSSKSKTFSFNSTCTEGTLYIDDKPTQLIKACGQAITEVDIRPSETETYDYEFKLVQNFSNNVSNDNIEYEGELRLTTGQHSAYLDWQDTKSNELLFRVK